MADTKTSPPSALDKAMAAGESHFSAPPGPISQGPDAAAEIDRGSAPTGSHEDVWTMSPASGKSFQLYTEKGEPVWVYGNSQPWSPSLVMWLTGFLAFIGIAAVLAIAYTARRETNRLAVIRLIGIILIIIIAATLVVGGFSDRQIATVIGLLGTIAGYLAGSRQASDTPTDGAGGAPRVQAAPPQRE